MKIAYFHCFAGASGDMFLGSLLDLGADLQQFKQELGRLGIDGWDLDTRRVTKNGITGTKVEITMDEDHHHRHLSHIVEIIQNAGLPQSVVEGSVRTFKRLAQAEAAVHGVGPEEVHFHEVGAKDAIIDIVGTHLLIHMLGIEAVYASDIHLGTGFTKAAHGKIPVPAPATLGLLTGVPTYSTGIQAELVTPTGAALLAELAQGFGTMPHMTITGVGYGAGSRDLEIPNLLRVVLGTDRTSLSTDTVQIVETNIDDMNPEHYDHVSHKLFEAGAADVYFTPIIMKKGRPAVKLTALVPEGKLGEVARVLFRETTTFGIRTYPVQRKKLERSFLNVSTTWGNVNVKVGYLDGRINVISPEHDDCRRLAQESGVPLREIYERARQEAEALLKK